MAGLPWVLVFLILGWWAARRGWMWFSVACFVAAGVTGAGSGLLQTMTNTLETVITGIWSAIISAFHSAAG